AVHAGHVDIEQHDGDFLRQCTLQSRRAIVEPTRVQAALRCRLHQQQPAEILIVGDDRDRLLHSIPAHAVALSFSSWSSSMSRGCAVRSRSNCGCTPAPSPATQSCSSRRTSCAYISAPTLAALEASL